MNARRPAFVLTLAVMLLAGACIPPWAFVGPSGPPSSTTGTLEVTIDYTGTWYRETFDYAPDAENIRHVVLIVPQDQAEQVDPSAVFHNLDVFPDSVAIRADRPEFAWLQAYIYQAPNAHLSQELAPGTYAVATAFLAAPLNREEAGVGEDAVLWPGVTGGGASTDYQSVTIRAGETTSLTITMTDDNGWG